MTCLKNKGEQNYMNKKNFQKRKDYMKIEDKFFKESLPGINRLLKKLGINHTIVEIVPNEFLNYKKETKTMDLGGLTERKENSETENKNENQKDIKSKDKYLEHANKKEMKGLKDENMSPINIEFKSNYPTPKEIENTLEYSFYLASKYGKPVYSYIISTANKDHNDYKMVWHNNENYIIPLKTLKEFDAEETRLKIQNKLDKHEDITDEDLTDISVITFMNSDKDPKELLIISLNLINQINENNSVGITIDDINGVKNLLVLLAMKFTDTEEEFKEIERMVKMNGGILQGTAELLKSIGREEGIEKGRQEGIEKGRQEVKKEWDEEKIETAKYLLSIGTSIEDISKATKLDIEEIKKLEKK